MLGECDIRDENVDLNANQGYQEKQNNLPPDISAASANPRGKGRRSRGRRKGQHPPVTPTKEQTPVINASLRGRGRHKGQHPPVTPTKEQAPVISSETQVQTSSSFDVSAVNNGNSRGRGRRKGQRPPVTPTKEQMPAVGLEAQTQTSSPSDIPAVNANPRGRDEHKEQHPPVTPTKEQMPAVGLEAQTQTSSPSDIPAVNANPRGRDEHKEQHPPVIPTKEQMPAVGLEAQTQTSSPSDIPAVNANPRGRDEHKEQHPPVIPTKEQAPAVGLEAQTQTSSPSDIPAVNANPRGRGRRRGQRPPVTPTREQVPVVGLEAQAHTSSSSDVPAVNALRGRGRRKGQHPPVTPIRKKVLEKNAHFEKQTIDECLNNLFNLLQEVVSDYEASNIDSKNTNIFSLCVDQHNYLVAKITEEESGGGQLRAGIFNFSDTEEARKSLESLDWDKANLDENHLQSFIQSLADLVVRLDPIEVSPELKKLGQLIFKSLTEGAVEICIANYHEYAEGIEQLARIISDRSSQPRIKGSVSFDEEDIHGNYESVLDDSYEASESVSDMLDLMENGNNKKYPNEDDNYETDENILEILGLTENGNNTENSNNKEYLSESVDLEQNISNQIFLEEQQSATNDEDKHLTDAVVEVDLAQSASNQTSLEEQQSATNDEDRHLTDAVVEVDLAQSAPNQISLEEQQSATNDEDRHLTDAVVEVDLVQSASDQTSLEERQSAIDDEDKHLPDAVVEVDLAQSAIDDEDKHLTDAVVETVSLPNIINFGQDKDRPYLFQTEQVPREPKNKPYSAVVQPTSFISKPVLNKASLVAMLLSAIVVTVLLCAVVGVALYNAGIAMFFFEACHITPMLQTFITCLEPIGCYLVGAVSIVLSLAIFALSASSLYTDQKITEVNRREQEEASETLLPADIVGNSFADVLSCSKSNVEQPAAILVNDSQFLSSNEYASLSQNHP